MECAWLLLSDPLRPASPARQSRIGSPASAGQQLIIKVLRRRTGDLFGTGTAIRRFLRRPISGSRVSRRRFSEKRLPLFAASLVPRDRGGGSVEAGGGARGHRRLRRHWLFLGRT